jgi:hypothetical protein
LLGPIHEGNTMTTPVELKTPPNLNSHHVRTYEEIFRHPAAHNLAWHDVLSLLSALADDTDESNGNIHVTRNGHTAVFHAPKHESVVSAETSRAVRHFLENSGEIAIPRLVAAPVRLLVIIDHHEAKIYRTESHGSLAQKLTPYDPHGFRRHLRTEVPETAGKREPERKSFYENIVVTLRGADEILIFGTGTGKSSAMDHLVAELKHYHGDVAEHVVGSIVVDESHLSEAQVLARAREFFGSVGAKN